MNMRLLKAIATLLILGLVVGAAQGRSFAKWDRERTDKDRQVILDRDKALAEAVEESCKPFSKACQAQLQEIDRLRKDWETLNNELSSLGLPIINTLEVFGAAVRAGWVRRDGQWFAQREAEYRSRCSVLRTQIEVNVRNGKYDSDLSEFGSKCTAISDEYAALHRKWGEQTGGDSNDPAAKEPLTQRELERQRAERECEDLAGQIDAFVAAPTSLEKPASLGRYEAQCEKLSPENAARVNAWQNKLIAFRQERRKHPDPADIPPTKPEPSVPPPTADAGKKGTGTRGGLLSVQDCENVYKNIEKDLRDKPTEEPRDIQLYEVECGPLDIDWRVQVEAARKRAAAPAPAEPEPEPAIEPETPAEEPQEEDEEPFQIQITTEIEYEIQDWDEDSDKELQRILKQAEENKLRNGRFDAKAVQEESEFQRKLVLALQSAKTALERKMILEQAAAEAEQRRLAAEQKSTAAQGGGGGGSNSGFATSGSCEQRMKQMQAEAERSKARGGGGDVVTLQVGMWMVGEAEKIITQNCPNHPTYGPALRQAKQDYSSMERACRVHGGNPCGPVHY